MSAELIVRFRAGTNEAEARALVVSMGCDVRRRMRDDSDEIVTLLIKGPPDAIGRARTALDRDPHVELVEDNAGGFGILG